eukprot:153702_1
MSMYQKCRNSMLKLKHQSFILPITEENTFEKSCIESATIGSFSALFNSQLKPIKGIENIRDKDNDGNSLLHIACLNKQLHLVEAFLSITNLFNVNIQNDMGNTPLHLIITKDTSYIPIIECLIKNYNASPIIRNKNAETPQFLLSFSQFGLQQMPELNILLSMHTFRRKKENEMMNLNSNESSLRSIKSKIAKIPSHKLIIYKQIYRHLANGSAWLRKEHLSEIFEQLDIRLIDQQLEPIINIIDINNDRHVDFDDFLAFLLMPLNDWTKNVLSKNNRNKKREKVKQFKDSIYYTPLLQTGIITVANELEEPIKINKENYIKLNQQFGEIFSCKPEEIDFVLKHIVKYGNQDDDHMDDDLDQSEEIKQDYIDKNIWKKIVNHKINVKHKRPIKEKKQ